MPSKPRKTVFSKTRLSKNCLDTYEYGYRYILNRIGSHQFLSDPIGSYRYRCVSNHISDRIRSHRIAWMRFFQNRVFAKPVFEDLDAREKGHLTPNVWTSECLTFGRPASGCPDVQTSRRPDVRTSGRPNVRRLDVQKSGVQTYPDIR